MTTLRDAIRSFASSPLTSFAAALSLVLGIAGAVAIFSILDALYLKPLPIRDPASLVVMDGRAERGWYGVSYPVWKEIKERGLFTRPAAWAKDRVSLAQFGRADFANVMWVTGDFFDTLGLSGQVGRVIEPADDRRGGGATGPVAVISDAFWRTHFGRSQNVIGQPLQIEGVSFTIVGVTPGTFHGLEIGETFDAALPLEAEPLLERVPKRLDSASWTWLQVAARLPAGGSIESLAAELEAARPAVRLATMPSFNRPEDADRYLRETWTVTKGSIGVSRLRRQYTQPLLILLGVVAVVLFIGIGNVAALMVARSAERRREFSVRLALGASRARLVRQCLMESLLLAALGGIVGCAVARAASEVLVAQLSTWVSGAVLDLAVDWRVAFVTSLTTVAAALVFGSVPAYLSMRAPAIEALTGDRTTPKFIPKVTGKLLVFQVAASLVLLAAAGLFLKSFAALEYRDIGFDRSRILIAAVDVRHSAVPVAQRSALYERLLGETRSLPGVENASISLATPLGNAGVRFTPAIDVPGSRIPGVRQVLSVPASPGWFQTYGTEVIAGRDFDGRDLPGAREVAIVNRAFASRYFGNAGAVGQTLIEVVGPTQRRPVEIVGVVEDAAFTNVRTAIEPTIYRPLAQKLTAGLLSAMPTISLSVRAAGHLAPSSLMSSVTDRVSQVDPRLSVTAVPLEEQLRVFSIRERLLAALAAFYGAFGLLLTAIGVYGTTAYSVARQRREIGIRLALGARSNQVVWMIVRRALTFSVMGAAAGVLLTIVSGRVITSLLYSISARDPLTIVAVVVVTIAVCSLAAWLPARTASGVHAADLLREG